MPGRGITGNTGWISPAGRLHAVDPASESVLCGQPLRQLVAFRELQWSALTSGIRCPDCSRALAAVAAQPVGG